MSRPSRNCSVEKPSGKNRTKGGEPAPAPGSNAREPGCLLIRYYGDRFQSALPPIPSMTTGGENMTGWNLHPQCGLAGVGERMPGF
jgi:hypothetical protein